MYVYIPFNGTTAVVYSLVSGSPHETTATAAAAAHAVCRGKPVSVGSLVIVYLLRTNT